MILQQCFPRGAQVVAEYFLPSPLPSSHNNHQPGQHHQPTWQALDSKACCHGSLGTAELACMLSGAAQRQSKQSSWVWHRQVRKPCPPPPAGWKDAEQSHRRLCLCTQPCHGMSSMVQDLVCTAPTLDERSERSVTTKGQLQEPAVDKTGNGGGSQLP